MYGEVESTRPPRPGKGTTNGSPQAAYFRRLDRNLSRGCSSFCGRSFCRLRFRFGGCGGLWFALGRFAIAAGRCRRRRILFRRFLIFFAAIIGDVKATAFEDQTSPSTNRAFYFAFAPFFLGAGAFRANFQSFRRNRLKLFKLMSALFADVLISWHSIHSNSWVKVSGQEKRVSV